ncbi:hypothetical protein GQ53DRAFT_749850 [Thozetella sp. PMI_491]|nr:hypothetical protein GQ53DRAFT_749850 [Thozetella sp. PMI_491]
MDVNLPTLGGSYPGILILALVNHSQATPRALMRVSRAGETAQRLACVTCNCNHSRDMEAVGLSTVETIYLPSTYLRPKDWWITVQKKHARHGRA